MSPASTTVPPAIGQAAEQQACLFLQQQGLQLITKNYHCRYGEIDLIMQHQDQLVFVEVRFRRHHRYGTGAESITRHKQARLLATAQHYLQRQNSIQAARFDVISMGLNEGAMTIDWIRDAFQA